VPSAHILPVPLTPLLGRDRELDQTLHLLASTRLLTITGAGGSGKTRLALELAHHAADRYGRAVWIDLAAVTDGNLIAQQMLETLGLRESPTFDDAELLIESLRGQSHLLVLDNCEHVVDGCAALAEKILRSSLETAILTTTREPLGIAGEQTWLVPPLASPDAITLFCERARAVAPGFTIDGSNRATVAHICARLDGIPLAIELAAARVKVLSVEQIAARLDDAFALLSAGSRTLARHRTIRETIDWSYRLLSPAEQKLLQRLSVFAGGFSLAAAESVCEENVLQTLAALVDKSLVVAGAGRYRLLDTVRQFAADKLAQSGERDAVRARHARYYFALVERSERRIYAGASDLAALASVDEEIENIRRTLEWTEEDPAHAEMELRMLWALHWYWFARGHFHEARRRLVRGLARGVDADPVVRARALVAGGNAAVWQGDWAALRPAIDEAVSILRPTNNLRALANALLLLGCAHAFAEKNDQAARRVFIEAEEVARRNGRNVALALTLYWAGVAAVLRNDWPEARRAFGETREIGIAQHNLPAIGHGSTFLAQVALHEGNSAEAVAFLLQAFETHLQTGDRWGLAQTVEAIGLALIENGEVEAGTRLLAAAESAWLHMGARPGRRDTLEQEKDARIRQALGDDRLRRVLASGAALSWEEMLAAARQHLGQLAAGREMTAATVTSAPALRVTSLGRVQIEVESLILDSGSSSSARARELLLFLLSTPAGVTKEEIGAALWPDADPAKLRNNFHVTVHRLRKMLGRGEWVIAEGELYSLDRSRGVEFDAERFEREVKAALKRGDVTALEAAAGLYHGDFAQGLPAGEWHFAVRDRLRDLYGEALRVIGRAKVSGGDFVSAVPVYQRLVAADDLDEQSYRNLMNALARSGDVDGAAAVYRRLTDTLRRELQTEPDPATARLHARIVAGELPVSSR
jgi:predicted ATPase/DNA-binding SARP family transcriptional activator